MFEHVFALLKAMLSRDYSQSLKHAAHSHPELCSGISSACIGGTIGYFQVWTMVYTLCHADDYREYYRDIDVPVVWLLSHPFSHPIDRYIDSRKRIPHGTGPKGRKDASARERQRRNI